MLIVENMALHEDNHMLFDFFFIHLQRCYNHKLQLYPHIKNKTYTCSSASPSADFFPLT